MTTAINTFPRRLYSTRKTVAFLYAGKLYMAPEKGDFRTDTQVVVTAVNDDGSLAVKQRRAHAKSVVGTFRAELTQRCKA